MVGGGQLVDVGGPCRGIEAGAHQLDKKSGWEDNYFRVVGGGQLVDVGGPCRGIEAGAHQLDKKSGWEDDGGNGRNKR